MIFCFELPCLPYFLPSLPKRNILTLFTLFMMKFYDDEMLYFHCLWLPYLDLPWFRLRDTYLAPLQSGNLILLTTHYLLHANHHLLLSTHYLLLLGIKIQDGKLWSKWTFLLVLSVLVLWQLTTWPICLVKTCGSNSRNRHIIWNLASALWYY